MTDPRERLRIQPDDVVLVHQKPGAAFMNATLNWLGGEWITNAFILENTND